MKLNPPSTAERTMWWRLRLARTGSSFRREHPIGLYRADFACIELGLVIELDGGQHMTSVAQAHDARRDAFLRSNGWTVLRVWTRQWFENPDGVMQAIDEAMAFARLEREQVFDGVCARTPLNRLRLSASSQNCGFAASSLAGRLREAVVGC
jgi:very-short-patch-repair endonuclease